ncbi:MAG: hypothetical protein B7Z45_07440, partial [Azorhizobium sp. 12-66-6]
MQVWMDPTRLQMLNLTSGDVVAALQKQNVQVASGVLNQPPVENPRAFQVAVRTLGRLTTPEQFGDVVIKQTGTALVRLKDVARIEIAAQDYSSTSYLDRNLAISLGVFQRPGSNALATGNAVVAAMAELGKELPEGVKYAIYYNPTEFIQQSVEAVLHTIIEAVILVVIVVVLFLQTWRAAIIPIVAIPISLVGTFFVMSLFGLVLAIGIVVDDAIVVVENVERNIQAGLSPRDAAYKTMDEVGGALVAISLVLSAVFIPTVFITGISGQFYQQFALTIAASTLISLLVSLTLSPAMCALLLKPHQPDHKHAWYAKPLFAFFGAFNRMFEGLGNGYAWLTSRLVRLVALVLVVYLGVVGLGRIGTAAALRAKALGFKVVFYDPYLPNGADKAVGIKRARTLEELLPQVDVLSLHCPLNAETRHLIAERELALLKPSAFVVNTARGGVIQKTAIL